MADRPPGSVRIDPGDRVAVVVQARSGSGPADAVVSMRLRETTDPAVAEDRRRVVEYHQFADVTALETCLSTAFAAPSARYDVRGVVAPPQRTSVLIRPGHLIELITMTAAPDRVEELLEFNAEETRTLFRPQAGFVGAVLHRASGETDARTASLLEIVVWESEAHLDAASSAPGFVPHVRRDSDLADRIDIRRYELVDRRPAP